MEFSIEGLRIRFPYSAIYAEQYEYMHTLLKSIRAGPGHAMLEIPTAAGSIPALLSLLVAYQQANQDAGKLVIGTNHPQEASTYIRELKRLAAFNQKEASKFFAIQWTTRSTLCVNDDFKLSGPDRTVPKANSFCFSRTSPWARSGTKVGNVKQESNEGCSYFQGAIEALSPGSQRLFATSDLPPVLSSDDLRRIGKQRGICPYYWANQLMQQADVVVCNTMQLLDPKSSSKLFLSLPRNSILVFDSAGVLESSCINALSVTLNHRSLQLASESVTKLSKKIEELKIAKPEQLEAEYKRLVQGLPIPNQATTEINTSSGVKSEPSHQNNTTSVVKSESSHENNTTPVVKSELSHQNNPTSVVNSKQKFENKPIPECCLFEGFQEPVASEDAPPASSPLPGTIRRADHFVKQLDTIIKYFNSRLRGNKAVKDTSSEVLHNLFTTVHLNQNGLRYWHRRLNALVNTLEWNDLSDLEPIVPLLDFVTLMATPKFQKGMIVLVEPHLIGKGGPADTTDPTVQIVCLNAVLALKPLLRRFRNMVFTGSSLSPLNVQSKVLGIQCNTQVSFLFKFAKCPVQPVIVARGGNQTPIIVTSPDNARDDEQTVRHFGQLLIELARVVPDGIVAYFPTQGYVETILEVWHELGFLQQILEHKLVFTETKDLLGTTLAADNYRRACDSGRGGLFVCSARGRIAATGFVFDRHYCRCAVICGVPFPMVTRELQARVDDVGDRTGVQQYPSLDAMRTASEIAGSSIHSKRDPTLIVLADKRFGNVSKQSLLPPWLLDLLAPEHLSMSVEEAAKLSQVYLKSVNEEVDPVLLKHTTLSVEDLSIQQYLLENPERNIVFTDVGKVKTEEDVKKENGTNVVKSESVDEQSIQKEKKPRLV